VSIIVKELSKIYDKQIAVNKISFEALPGRILGFLGPNGAGKSTTMKMITGFLSANHGEIFVSGLNINSESISVKQKIGYLPENNPLYFDMYVKEYLQFVGEIYGVQNLKNRIVEVIEATGLQKEQHKQIGQLSKGYKQRVGLAQAIIHQPEVLILDEPTSGLDPNQLIEIRNLIKELGKTKTVILSTHIMQEVEAICDDVIIINKGEIVANNSLKDLLELHQEKSLEPIFVKLTNQ
jgi:ABC-2 type transport system ATP-binding protein